MWAIPSFAFAVLALVVGLSPTPPGPWFDRLLHIFGIGSVAARPTAISLWVGSALFSGLTGLLLARFTSIGLPLLIVDAAAVGVALALLIIWLASRRGGRGSGVSD